MNASSRHVWADFFNYNDKISHLQSTRSWFEAPSYLKEDQGGWRHHYLNAFQEMYFGHVPLRRDLWRRFQRNNLHFGKIWKHLLSYLKTMSGDFCSNSFIGGLSLINEWLNWSHPVWFSVLGKAAFLIFLDETSVRKMHVIVPFNTVKVHILHFFIILSLLL